MLHNPYKIVKMFEEEVAHYTGSKYAVAVDSCTNALFLCCKYLDVKKNGIGPHGDTERVVVACFRIGEAMPMKFGWFHKSPNLVPTIFLVGNSTFSFSDIQAHLMC